MNSSMMGVVAMAALHLEYPGKGHTLIRLLLGADY